MELQRLAALVAKGVFDDDSVQLLDAKSFRNPHSLVYRLVYGVGGVPKALIVKLPADSGTSTQNLRHMRREYILTKRVKKVISSTPELATVTPASYIDEIDGFVTWEIRGIVLENMINNTLRFDFRGEYTRLTRFADLAGRWLQRFHSLSLHEGDSDLSDNLMGYCEGRLDALSRIEHSEVSKNLAESLKRTIAVWIDNMFSSPDTNIILCHNDYSPHNIIVTTEGICVLDFSFAGPGVPAFDVACFWHKLEDMKSSPFVQQKKVAILQNRFLDSYGIKLDSNRPEVKLGLARLVLSKMLTLLNCHSFRPDKIYERRRRYASYVSLLKSEFEIIQ